MSYEIKRWDVILNENGNRIPIIYIEPDLEFKQFIKENDYNVIVQIIDSGTVYDNKVIPGRVDQSSFVPNCRPNFFYYNGYYVITLNSNWYGYPNPNKLGKAIIYGY